jgi:tetratricopeptide (TPR) repeat protein
MGETMKKKVVYIIARIAVLFCAIVMTVVFINTGTAAARAAKQVNLGYRYLAEGNYQGASQAFEKALRIDSKNVGARMGLAEVCIETGEFEYAEKRLEEVLELKPGMTEAGIMLAEVYDKNDDTDKAIEILEDIIREKEDINAYIALEDIKVKSGDIEGAILLLDEAYQETNSSEILAELEEIKPEAPKASKKAGTYDEPIQVELETSVTGWAVYYTNDGSEPSQEAKVCCNERLLIFFQSLPNNPAHNICLGRM